MLLVAKIAKKNKFYIYSFVTMIMFSGGIFSIYQNYISNLDLIAPDIAAPAVPKSRILNIVDKEVPNNDVEDEQINYKSSNLLDLTILSDPKFRSLKKNVAAPIDVKSGKRNPFKP